MELMELKRLIDVEHLLKLTLLSKKPMKLLQLPLIPL